MSPRRIQRCRTKGWKMPKGAVYVGRSTKWGNPYRIGVESVDGDGGQTREESLWAYANLFLVGKGKDVSELRGKDLVCWCPLDQPCHADILLGLANRCPS